MTQEEFEALIGHQVAAEEFDTFNEVYVNCEMDKDAFCKAIDGDDRKATLELIFDLSAGVSHYKTSRNDILEQEREIGEHLAQKAHDYDDHDLREAARMLLGRHNYITYCLSQGLALKSSDREYIIAHLRED